MLFMKKNEELHFQNANVSFSKYNFILPINRIKLYYILLYNNK